MAPPPGFPPEFRPAPRSGWAASRGWEIEGNPEWAELIPHDARSAAPGTRVLAFELVIPQGDQPHMSKMIDLTMLGMLNGRERTEAEMRSLFEGAGLIYDGPIPTPTPISIIEARVP